LNIIILIIRSIGKHPITSPGKRPRISPPQQNPSVPLQPQQAVEDSSVENMAEVNVETLSVQDEEFQSPISANNLAPVVDNNTTTLTPLHSPSSNYFGEQPNTTIPESASEGNFEQSESNLPEKRKSLLLKIQKNDSIRKPDINPHSRVIKLNVKKKKISRGKTIWPGI